MNTFRIKRICLLLLAMIALSIPYAAVAQTNKWAATGAPKSSEPPKDPIIRITSKQELAAIRSNYSGESRPDYIAWMRQGNPAGLAGIKRGLRSPDGALLYPALYDIWKSGDHGVPTFDEETFDLLLSSLDEPGSCGELAIRAISVAFPERAAVPLIAHLKGGKFNWYKTIDAILALGRTSSSPATIDFLCGLFHGVPKEAEDPRRLALEALSQMHRIASDADRSRIEACLIPAYLAPELPIQDMKPFILDWRHHPSVALLPVFERLLREEDAPMACIEAIVKIKGAAARPLMDSLLREPNADLWSFQLIEWAWKGDTSAALAVYLQFFHKTQDWFHIESYIDKCWSFGGQKMAEDFIIAATRDHPAERDRGLETLKERYLPIDALHPLWQKSKALYQAGILAQPHTLEELERIRRAQDFNYTVDFGAMLLADMPGFIMTPGYRTNEVSEVQIVLHTLLPAAGKRFASLECYQHRELLPEANLDYYPSKMSLWVFFKGIGYTLAQCPFGDHVPIKDMITLLNAVFQDAKIPERIVEIPARFVFRYCFMQPDKLPQMMKILAVSF